MKICFIGDSRSIHMQRWVRWFARRHEVTVIVAARDDGLAEYAIGSLPTHARFGSRLAQSALHVRRMVARHRPDVLHCHYINESGWLGASSGFHPLVITAWGSDLYRAPAESRLARYLNPWALRSADWVTCDSSDQAAVARSWGVAPQRVSVIGWGVDRDEFYPTVDGTSMRTRLQIPPHAPVLLSPRQWIPNSNIPAVIAAHAELPASVYLILKHSPSGASRADAVVRQAIAESPARDRIRILGDIEENELPRLYTASDAVISLCTTDGTPMSVLEAMAAGRPVVAFDHPSLSEWVSEPGGRLVATLEPSSVAAAVTPFLVDQTARVRASVRNVEVITARADRGSELGRMEVIYQEMAARGRDGNGS